MMDAGTIAIARKAIYENIEFYTRQDDKLRVAKLKDALRELEKITRPKNDYFREAENEYPY